MIDELKLQTGVDIPFPAARVSIHQPKIKEIAYIGEAALFQGCELLRLSKNSLADKDKVDLENKSDFDIIMSIMRDKSNQKSLRVANAAKLVLLLLFPNFQISLSNEGISLKDMNSDEVYIINNDCFESFKNIVIEMFCLKEKASEEYNPSGGMAADMAKKFAERKKKLAAQKGKDTDQRQSSIFGRYISILSVGLEKDANSFLDYTVYQLIDEFKRYELKINYDIYLQAKLAGAKDLKEVENWMKDLNSKGKDSRVSDDMCF